jgi:beta-D-xylosidase 4
VQFAQGCNISDIDQSGFAAAIELARRADIVFFFGGINLTIEDEGRLLLQAIETVVRSPMHVVIMSGSGIDLSYIRDSPNYASLIWAGYPGQAGGTAIASVVLGQYNPGGRLPITFYPASYVDAVNMTDMQMRPSAMNPGLVYRI